MKSYHKPYIISESNFKKARAYRADAKTVTDLLTSSHARLSDEIQFSSVQREILNSRTNAPAPQRYPLFWRGVTAGNVLDTVIGSSESCSGMSRDIDIPLIGKVGPQGTRFNPSYLLKGILNYYDRPFTLDVVFDGTELTRNQRRAVAFVKAYLRDRLDPITPLTWEEAVDIVCSKDTASWPTGGSKRSPEVREWLLAHPLDLREASSLAGQRHQRNKHDDLGMPVPRVIFNADIRAVTMATMYEAPLIDALQKLAKTDSNCPFVELNGTNAVGASTLKWVRETPLSEYDSLEIDIKSMDTCFTRQHMEIVYEIIKDLFTDATYLWESMAFSHCSPIVVSPEITLEGEHTLLSGVAWTHIAESVLSLCVQTELAHSMRLATVRPDGTYATIVGLDNWGEYQIQVAGDDARLLIKRPTAAIYVDGAGRACSPVDVAVPLYKQWGLETSSEKIAIRRNYSNYCSKTYSAKAVVLGSDGNPERYRAVYSPVAAINAVYYPEYPLTDPSLINELLRVSAIVDQSYGSEHWNKLVDSLVNSLSRADVEKLSGMMESFIPECENAFQALGKAATWDLVIGDWTPSASQFLSYLTKWLGLTSSEKAELRSIISDVVRFRALHWLYRIDPRGVCDPNYDEYASRDAYTAMFEDVTTVTENGNTLRRPNTSKLVDILRGIHRDPDSVIRDPKNYRADMSFFDQIEVDNPMVEFGRKRPEQSVNVVEEHFLNGASLKDGNFWD